MSSIISELEHQQMEELRTEMADILPDDLNVDFNIHRWVHGWRGDIVEASRRFRVYIENRRAAGLDDPNFLQTFYTHPIVAKFAPYFSFTISPNVINPTHNDVVIIQRFQQVDYHLMTKVMTCGQFLMLYFAICEWALRQVLKCERESGRKSGLTLVFDLENFSLLPYANPNSAVIKIFVLCLRLLQDYFCDMLHRLVIINAPVLINVVLGILKRFLHPNTQQKFMVISRKEDLLTYVDSSVLPVHYGGTRRPTEADTRLGGRAWNIDRDTCAMIPRPVVTQQDLFVPTKFPRKPNVYHVDPKGRFELRRNVTEPGARILWQFQTSGEIQFTLVRVLPDGSQIRLIPRWVVITPKLPEEGSYICTEAGEYAIQFFNLHEGWSSVKLDYHFEIEP